jgi:formate hydrogenlyase subunit 3/multisubunit Na+/H+ antiporter MnhD subunit
MEVLLGAVGLLLASGLAALAMGRRGRASAALGAAGAVASCLGAAVPTVRVLCGGQPLEYRLPWPVPGGAFAVGLDVLSAYFLLPVLLLAALAAVYGGKYMQEFASRRSLGAPAFFLNLLVASMVMVLVARNGLLFLAAWELMSLSAYFLVTFEHERAEVRRAGWIYLVATHLGAAFLFALFMLLGRAAGGLDFAGFGAVASWGAGWSALLFLFALVGFGAKAGFVPWHVWLPEAHPAAPSHVSAIMSGVMIKTGLYGILRIATFLGEPAEWWGPLLIVIGLTGGLVGISLALSQRDLKRALAYSSIENVGLIALGLGVGFWGKTSGHPAMAVLGFAGGLLHVWNHALMKGLMFLAAGSVVHGAGTRDAERLGGLLKRMPQTGTAMILGSVAICGLPPLNGFVSEWLMYMGLMHGGLSHEGMSRVVLLLSVGLVAITGALALVCFMRIVGTVLLGEARGDAAAHAHESSAWMLAPMGVLGAACVIIAVLPGVVLGTIAGVVNLVVGMPANEFEQQLASADSPVGALAALNVGLWVALGIVTALLAALRRRESSATDGTWGCGYARPTARMQYTGGSFVEFLVMRTFPRLLRPRRALSEPHGLFPSDAAFASESPDPLTERVYVPFFARWAARFSRLRWVQQGKIHLYVIYILVVLVAALAWVSVRAWLTR